MPHFSQEYLDHIESYDWQDTRSRILQRAGGCCELCGRPTAVCGPLQVHHWTYKWLGCENDEDLVAVCDDCHCTFHPKRVAVKYRLREFCGQLRLFSRWDSVTSAV